MQVFKSRARMLVVAVAAALVMTVMAPMASFASSEGNRNTALGLAGAAAYLLVKGKTLPGIAAAAGAGYAYSRYQKERKEEQARERWNSRYARTYPAPQRYQSRDCDRYDNNYRDSRYSDGRYRDRWQRDHRDQRYRDSRERDAKHGRRPAPSHRR